MLHIILGILKFIGILLAVLLLLVLLVVLAALLVPVRYRIRIAKTDREMEAQARVTWLMHMISVFVSYDISKGEQQLVIRIFGIPLESILGVLKKLTTRKRRKSASAGHSSSEENTELDLQELAEDTEAASERVTEETPVKKTEETREGKPEEVKAKEVKAKEVKAKEVKEKEADEPKEPFYQKVFCKLQNICDKIKAIPEKIRNIVTKVLALIRKIISVIKGVCTSLENLYEKLVQIPDRIAALQTMLEAYEVKAVAGDVIKEVKYILAHYGPRKAEGYLHFGTGDPAATGQLTGLLYMILPTKAGTVEIQPEFTEAVFEADLTIKGHVRAVHIIPVGWRLLRNKRLMRLIKKIKKLRS